MTSITTHNTAYFTAEIFKIAESEVVKTKTLLKDLRSSMKECCVDTENGMTDEQKERSVYNSVYRAGRNIDDLIESLIELRNQTEYKGRDVHLEELIAANKPY